jgi:hypothetical protein
MVTLLNPHVQTTTPCADEFLKQASRRLFCQQSVACGELILPKSRKQNSKHSLHPATHPSYKMTDSDNDMRLCVHFGIVVAYDLFNSFGYSPLTVAYPLLQQAFVRFLQLVFPPTAQ